MQLAHDKPLMVCCRSKLIMLGFDLCRLAGKNRWLGSRLLTWRDGRIKKWMFYTTNSNMLNTKLDRECFHAKQSITSRGNITFPAANYQHLWFMAPNLPGPHFSSPDFDLWLFSLQCNGYKMSTYAFTVESLNETEVWIWKYNKSSLGRRQTAHTVLAPADSLSTFPTLLKATLSNIIFMAR